VTLPGPSAPPPQVGGGVFEVDIAQAPKAIRELEAARRELESIKRDAVYLGQISPPTRDQVSIDAAQALAMKATSGPHSFLEALTQGIAEIQRMVDALRASFEAYERSDQVGRAHYSET
jgi:hypothetical protein